MPSKQLTELEKTHLDEAFRFVRSKTRLRPKIALILGSGLGNFAKVLKVESSLSSGQIPYYPQSSVQGHAGKLIFGFVKAGNESSPPVLVLKGRVHFYESGSLDRVVFPILLLHRLGINSLIVTNAAGGANRQFSPGDLMLIKDFIQISMPPASIPGRKSPGRFLRAERRPSFDDGLQEIIRGAAAECEIPLQEGTYCWFKGPSYETRSEVQMAKRLGADAVGMSTVPEVVAACQLGMRVAGISLISNLATGISLEKLSHQEVTDTANRVQARFTNLLRTTLLNL
ncbi:MAG: purine-nucleoside phosphorylase [Bacteroidota bacterium]